MVCMGGLSHPSAPAGDLARRDAGARDRVASAAADARSPATRQAYAAQWRRFERWCAGRDIDAPAATPAEIVAQPLPCRRPARRRTQPGAAPRQARALTYDQESAGAAAALAARRRPRRMLGERRVDVFRMVKRRVKAVELGHAAICHTFRASGITAYLLNGGTLEPAQAIAGHESHRTTQLYHRTADDITVEDVERIKI